MDGDYYPVVNYTIQDVHGKDYLNGNMQGVDHEFAHQLLGNNSFHATGGNHFGHSYTCTFMGRQSGYGIMTSRSSFNTTNGFERWRLGWTSDYYNYFGFIIQANGTSSDIEKSDGPKTFYLRDFVTTGDVIRIKLPYKDRDECSNQHIWLENHQVGRNEKEDFFKNSYLSCKDAGTPGIYSYLQVGKDTIESINEDAVWPNDETDNIRMFDAEGNYNMIYSGLSNDCAGWDANRKNFKYVEANPLSGQNDYTPLWDIRTTNTLGGAYENIVHVKELSGGSIANGWPRLGENSDAFIHGSVMDISSNPPPVNAVTNYVKQGSGILSNDLSVDIKENKTIYLTGLSIKMYEDGTSSFGNGCKIFKVEIDWDDYDVKNDVRWTGNICLKEQLNLLANKTILLNQSTVPTEIIRSTITGEFTPATYLSCDENSLFKMQNNSKLTLSELSTIEFHENSDLQMFSGSELFVGDGCKFKVNDNADILLSDNSKLLFACGSIIEIDDPSDINLLYASSELIISSGCIFSTGYATKQQVILGVAGLGKIIIFENNINLSGISLNTEYFVDDMSITIVQLIMMTM